MAIDTHTDTHEAGLDVLCSLSREVILAEVELLNREQELNRAIREMVRQGILIENISEATGLLPREVRIRAEAHQDFSDLNVLMGIG